MLADGRHDLPPGKLAMVVTYLEARALKLRNVPEPEGVTFTELPRNRAAYLDVYARVGADWLWGDVLRLSADAFDARLQSADTSLWTLRQDGVNHALLELDFSRPDRCKLAYFGVSTALIGSGAGAFLMDRAQELAFAQRDLLTVETCTLDSPQALGFYLRSGFTATRRGVEVVDDPRMTGLMDAALAPELPKI
ncbi:MAG: GNAT family N-acetyltransferase [Pseudomonadota bacterium]